MKTLPLLIGSIVAAAIGLAQEVRTTAPAALPASVPASSADTVAGSPDAPVVVLRSIVVLPNPEAFRVEGIAGAADGVDAAQLEWLDRATVAGVLAPLLGRPIDADSLLAVRVALSDFLRQQKHGFARVSIPAQDIIAGTLQVIVIRSRVGEVRVEGAGRWSEASYRAAVRAQAGEVLEQERVEADVDWLNRNPFRSVRLRVMPGDELGTTDVTLITQERRPWRLQAGFNNTGNASTDDERVFAGVTWGAPFGRSDIASYQFSSDPRAKYLRSHSGSYTWHLPWRHALTLSGAYATISAKMEAPLDQDGSSQSAGLRYEVPLAARGAWSPRLSGGVDFKRSDNNILFAAIPITNNLTDIVQAFVNAGVSRQDRAGFTDVAVTVTASPGGVTSRNEDAAFGPSRAAAEAQYAFATFDVTRFTNLPHRLVWRSSARAQLSTGNLLGSEQLGFGGSAGLRGYDEGELYADEGLLWTNELRLPAFRVANRFGVRDRMDSLQPLVFIDAGWARVHTPLPGEPGTTNLASAGVGFRYGFGEGFALSADYGWQLKDSGLNRRNNHRGHVSAVFAW